MTQAPLNIFIVENHPDTLRCLRRYLERLGHRVQSASDMTAALAQVSNAEVDLLLSDLGLPDGDGWELLRQLGPDRRYLAVAMSGRGSSADLEKSHAAGYRHHLVKPFLPDELDPILEEARQLVASKTSVA